MADVYVKKSELTEALYSDMTGNEYFDFYVGTGNYRIKISEIAKHILGVVSGALRTIGTNVAGAILTTSGTQDVTNKDLKLCKINTGNHLTVTSTELNHCDNLAQNVQAALTQFSSDIGTNASDIVALKSDVNTLYSGIQSIRIDKTVSSEKAEIDVLEIDAVNTVLYDSIQVRIYIIGDGDTLEEVSSVGTVITPQTINNVVQLDTIKSPALDGTYAFIIYYKFVSA